MAGLFGPLCGYLGLAIDIKYHACAQIFNMAAITSMDKMFLAIAPRSLDTDL